MESDLLKKYMQNIEDFVFIEEKIVTYLWLCQILKIHVNTAKQLLHSFASKDDVKNRLLVTYVLGGELKNGKGRLLKLVIGDSKKAVEQLFSKITTDHIFSIQKSGGSFSSSDVFNSFPHFSVLPETRRFCPVRPIKKIAKRELNHITEAKNFLNPSLPVKKQITQQKEAESSKKEVKNGEDSKHSISENATSSNEPPAKQKKTSGNEKDLKSKGGDIGSFFSRQADKKSSEQPVSAKGKSEKKEEKSKIGIGAFFKPGNKSETSNKEVKLKETSVNSEPKENEKKEVPEVKKQNDVKEPASVPAKDKKQKSKEGKRKRKKKDDDVGKEKKRRKRIVSALSSDSESSGNESSDHEMEVEPEQPPPPPVEEEEEDMIPPTPGRKRVRKQIDKVSMDEDGFIITKKEFVYESCSDDETKEEKKENQVNNVKEDKKVETPEKEKKEKTPVSKNEVSASNGKQNKSPNNDKSNKQSSIMNFFKRKAVT